MNTVIPFQKISIKERQNAVYAELLMIMLGIFLGLGGSLCLFFGALRSSAVYIALAVLIGGCGATFLLYSLNNRMEVLERREVDRRGT